MTTTARSCALTIWENSNRGGRSATYTVGDVPFPDFIKTVPNDSVSSLEVTGSSDCRAALYQHHIGQGWSATFSPGFYDSAEIVKHGRVIDDASSARAFYER